MIIKPEKVVFESSSDVIDYITKGLPPTKKNFNAVMDAFNNEVPEGQTQIPGVNIIIPRDAKLEIDNEAFNKICRQVYKNRIRNRNLVIGVTAALTVGAIGVGRSRKKCKNCDED